MVDLDDARLHSSRLSMISSIQQSFCENYEDFDEDDEDICAEEVPEHILDKFQDLLTEIDRLNMQIEDFRAEKIRTPDTNIDIYLNNEQIKSLHGNLGNLLTESNQNTVFKLNKESLSLGTIKIEYDDTVERIRQLEVENINLRTQMLTSTIKKPRNSSSELSDFNTLMSMKIELEMKSLEIARKEQELQQCQEETI
jgi:regulator of replication initiation timing